MAEQRRVDVRQVDVMAVRHKTWSILKATTLALLRELGHGFDEDRLGGVTGTTQDECPRCHRRVLLVNGLTLFTIEGDATAIPCLRPAGSDDALVLGAVE